MASAFDLVMIGAGPACVGALSAIRPGQRICVLTGATPQHHPGKIHPKIRAVAHERREPPGLRRSFAIAGPTGSKLFSTAAEGGLANYWGQQFLRYERADPWPAYIFDDYTDYLGVCKKIESIFYLTPPTECTSDAAAIGGGYTAQTPRLLVGTDEAPGSDLFAMRLALRHLVARHAAQTIPLHAVSWAVDGGGVRIQLSDGETIRATRAVLAAGVVGSVQLTMASCPEVTAAEFSDHAPYMLYTRGLDRVRRVKRVDDLRHFNALTIEKLEDERCQLFASVYRMGQASLSLLLSAAGLPPMLRGWKAIPFADFVKPVQVWTEATVSRLRIDSANGTASVVGFPDRDADSTLHSFVQWLKFNGVAVKVTVSEIGGGLHYHAAMVTTDRGVMSLATFLAERFGQQVVCLDSSVLDQIGCRPHTLTAMASANKLSGRTVPSS